MKKITIFLLFMAAAFPALAQDADFGIKAGTNFSTAYAPVLEGIDTKAGLVAGVFGEFRVKRIGFQAEVLYSREGYSYTSDGSSYYYEARASLNYLDFPLLIKVYPAEWFSLDLGYQAGVLWDTAIHPKKNYSSDLMETRVSGVRSVNNSVVLGITFRFGRHVDLSARYNLGISDLENKLEGEMIRSRVGQLTLGYRF